MTISSEIINIVLLSLRVSIIASLIGLAIGAPLGAYICTMEGKSKSVWLGVFSALLAVPTVVVGLIVYLLLSKSGPLGWLELLFSPTAIIIAQVLINHTCDHYFCSSSLCRPLDRIW